MRLRNARLRTKVTALLVSLTALWAFTAWVTVRDGLNMLGVATLNTSVAEPAERLIVELQAERRLTAVTLGVPGAEQQRREALTAQRARTDEAGANFRELAGGGSVELMGSAALERRIGEIRRLLDGLPAARKAIDAGRADRARATTTFTDIVDAIFRSYDSMATLDDEELAKDTRTLIAMNRARDLLAQEDALVMGALTAGRFTDDERIQLTQLLGARRFLTDQAVAELPDADQRAYQRLAEGEQFTRLRSMENLLTGTRNAVSAGLVDAGRWSADSQPVQARFAEIVLTAGSGVVERATPVATGVIVRLVLAGGLGLIAVIASVVLAITTARALVQQLEKLRTAAWELADKRLPGVVDRIGHGEDVDVASEAPPLEFGDDQIGQVGRAFNAVQQTAIKVAAEQAQLRRDIADILRNLARRTQGLVHRQLSVLDAMERREQDPQELRDLFRLDHLATRMRRYAENLLVLSGAAPGRAWRESVPMLDVVRGALAEIEDYTRVDVLPMGEVSLDGRAVGDVIHLIAELVENAASFSPPYTTVKVGGHVVAHGYAVEIEDRGLGMSPEDIASTNERIANPPELKLSGNARLGLYVVSRLAERHEIRVAFKASPYGGTTVVVLIPQHLISDRDGASPDGGVSVQGPVQAGAAAGGGAQRSVPQARTAPAGPAGPHGAAVASARQWDPLAGGPGVPGHTASGGRASAARVPGAHRADASGPGVPVAAGSPASPAPVPPAPAPPASALSAPVFSDPAVAGPPAPASPTPVEAPVPADPSSTSSPSLMPPPDTSHTPKGLPRRVPQTHLAAPLREEEPAAEPPPADDDGERSPEEIRAAFSSFQAGTRRGRSDAAQLLGGESPEAGRPPM
ncbi:nitrate- and nitrite sensing domain-containing protein [Planomonospora sp. ID67723]|uniref:sensor histidine kinase n=1 Tax=Planomonospora sp. ID67723 TaxID=2738134 RepID=UPI0018C3B1FB|nr:nitrate- and nitrite sensing domain-containing protein [Planomonospora sp. ID67723]MBG0829821.1 nitrate- and nitrite sensing domain-containing protein [Planomonospora sp. ID67723]